MALRVCRIITVFMLFLALVPSGFASRHSSRIRGYGHNRVPTSHKSRVRGHGDGHYVNGHGQSHKGGHYTNRHRSNHHRDRKHDLAR